MTTGPGKPLRLQVSQRGTAAVVRVSGSASMTEADRLQERLEDLAAQRVPVIILDLTEMDFISSLGLGAIITGHLKCRHHRGQIRLVNPTPAVRELLETTRLTTLFGVYDSVEKALPGA
jgi:anti-sigma B factor antagonist